ncbi:S8 family serine peptidase [Streptomyces sp. NPDC020807]|uniref:S8 family serine peptidase n=1 Tax=Streptomyces sp. NPDC020807 TaxID=3155119 RepID=UPI0033FFB449
MKRPIGGVVVAAAAAAAMMIGVTPVDASPLTGTVSVSSDGPVAAALFDEAQSGGTVRVNVVTAQQSQIASVADAGQTLVSYGTLPMTTLRVDTAGLQELNSTPGVVSVTEDKVNRTTLDESTVRIGADKTVAAGKTGAGSTIAILDTGVAVHHPFLSGRVKAEACTSTIDAGKGATSLCPNGTQAQDGPGSADVESGPCATSGANCSHGTHVAGIAAGNGAGIAGAPRHGVAPGADIVAIQVFSKFDAEADCDPQPAPCLGAFDSSVAKGLEKVLELKNSGINIVAANLSLGSDLWGTACDKDVRKPVVDALRAAGVATVVSAGNSGATNAVSAPGCISSAVTVGSTTDDDQLSQFSNRGPLLDLLAPGTTIVSSVPGGGYASKNGTSMAAPHVAGAFAVLKQANPTLTVDQLEAKLKSDGTPVTYTEATTPRIQLDKAPAPAPAVPGDMTGDGKTDLVAIEDTGKLWLYPGTGTGALGARVQIGSGGWSGASIAHRGDWTGDKKEDLVAVVGGDLYVYPNTGNGVLGARIKLTTLNTATRITVPGDVTGDGQPDVLAIHDGVDSYDGALFLYAGVTGTTPAVLARKLQSSGWPTGVNLSAMGDGDKDGKVDLLSRDSTGLLRYHYWASSSTVYHPGGYNEYGHGYFPSTRPLIAGAGDADRNGVVDMWTTTNTGTLLFYKGGSDIHGPIDGPSVVVGTGGWGTIKAIS